jgi:hypothetical protein
LPCDAFLSLCATPHTPNSGRFSAIHASICVRSAWTFCCIIGHKEAILIDRREAACTIRVMAKNEAHRRQFLQARSLRQEAMDRLKDYDAILGRTQADYERLRTTGIQCKAFMESDGTSETVHVTRLCWNHVFKHRHKRASKIDKLERACAFPLALKLLQRTTTYQEVSRERDRGNNVWLYFGIVGYVRGVRMKVIIRRQEKSTNPQKVLFSFFQMSSAPAHQQHKEELVE